MRTALRRCNRRGVARIFSVCDPLGSVRRLDWPSVQVTGVNDPPTGYPLGGGPAGRWSVGREDIATVGRQLVLDLFVAPDVAVGGAVEVVQAAGRCPAPVSG